MEVKELEKSDVLILNKTKRSDILYIDPKSITIVEGFNTRLDYGNIDDLTNSIIENGVRVPMRGYKEGETYYLTDGHRRLKAVQAAIEKGVDIARVPFISEKKKTMEERIFDILLFNDGKELTPLELGETYKRLNGYGYNFTEIAKKIGKTVKHVSDMITVASSSKEVKEMITENQVSATLVAELNATLKNQEEAESIIKNASLETGKKVTKKDVQNFLPKKESEMTFTLEQVRSLLTAQIEMCAAKAGEYKDEVLKTELIA